MKIYYYIIVVGFLLLSCNRTKQSDSAEKQVGITQNSALTESQVVVYQNTEFPDIQEDTNQDGSLTEIPVDITPSRAFFEIPVDIDQNYSLPLSEIAEEITAIELEFTDESPINPDNIQRILISENHIITVETVLTSGSTPKILVFSKDGKFLNRIGSVGQGPGEYTWILNAALDEKNKRLFITTLFSNKIICYSLDGKFLKEITRPIKSADQFLLDINCIDDEVLLLVNKQTSEAEISSQTSFLYRLNDEFQVIDSCFIRKNDFGSSGGGIMRNYSPDFILKGNPSVYLYNSELYTKRGAPVEKVIRDTLYRIEHNQLVPELKLKFRNDGIDRTGKFIDINNIFRSTRYIFAVYQIYETEFYTRIYHHFCYDTKTGKSYNMRDGYTDDINGIEKRIGIRPSVTDSETIYYWHTNMKPEDKEEPNPTLYIVKLKQ